MSGSFRPTRSRNIIWPSLSSIVISLRAPMTLDVDAPLSTNIHTQVPYLKLFSGTPRMSCLIVARLFSITLYKNIKVTKKMPNILKNKNTIEENIITLHTINAFSIIVSQSKKKFGISVLSPKLPTFSQLFGFKISFQYAKLLLREFKNYSGKIWVLQLS